MVAMVDVAPFHKEIEAFGVPTEHVHCHLCHLGQGGILSRVSVDVIFHVVRFKEAHEVSHC